MKLTLAFFLINLQQQEVQAVFEIERVVEISTCLKKNFVEHATRDVLSVVFEKHFEILEVPSVDDSLYQSAYVLVILNHKLLKPN